MERRPAEREPWLRSDGSGGTLLTVWVVPGASTSAIVGRHGTALKLRVAAPPEAGRANRAVEELLGSRLEVPVRVVRGAAGRRKTVAVPGLAPGQVEVRLSR